MSGTKKCMFTRVRKLREAYPPSTASPFGRINLETSQATASNQMSPHSVPIRVRVRVRVWSSTLSAMAKIPLHITYVPDTTYLTPGTSYSVVFRYSSIYYIHFIDCAFKLAHPGAQTNQCWCLSPSLIYHTDRVVILGSSETS